MTTSIQKDAAVVIVTIIGEDSITSDVMITNKFPSPTTTAYYDPPAASTQTRSIYTVDQNTSDVSPTGKDYVFVAINSKDANAPGSDFSSVTFNGNAMTELYNEAPSGDYTRYACWYYELTASDYGFKTFSLSTTGYNINGTLVYWTANNVESIEAAVTDSGGPATTTGSIVVTGLTGSEVLITYMGADDLVAPTPIAYGYRDKEEMYHSAADTRYNTFGRMYFRMLFGNVSQEIGFTLSASQEWEYAYFVLNPGLPLGGSQVIWMM
jgi:hypothetical protein